MGFNCKKVICNALVCEEEVWCIELVKFPDGFVLYSNREMREIFRTHFHDRFDCCPDLPVLEFRSYSVDIPRPREAKVASCESIVTEREVRDPLKQVGLNKSSGLDGLPY